MLRVMRLAMRAGRFRMALSWACRACSSCFGAPSRSMPTLCSRGSLLELLKRLAAASCPLLVQQRGSSALSACLPRTSQTSWTRPSSYSTRPRLLTFTARPSTTLLDGVEACLDDPSAVAQHWLLQEGGKLLQGSGGGLANLGSRATTFQKALLSKLSEEHAQVIGGESLGQRLNTHVRSQTAKRALAGASRYAVTTRASRYAVTSHVAMLKLVLSTDPLALTKDEKDLTYLLEKLGKLEGADVTSELWQDFYESWASFLSLRSKLEAECAQQIFDAIATDESVLAGLAAAHLLKDAVIKSGQVPNELLLQLKQGPGKHIKNQAYAYRHKLDAELTRLGRIRDLQQRAVALTGTCIIAAFVSIGNVLGRFYYDAIRADSTMAGIIAGVAIATVLFVCITVTACIRRLRQ